MKTIRSLTGGLCLLTLLSPVLLSAAQSDGPKAKLMAKYDTNKNGVIDGDEIAAVRAAFAAEPGDLKKYDANKDGKLDDAEIALIKGPGGKKGEKGEAKKEKKEKKEEAAETPKTGVKADAKEEPAKTPGK